jgi:RNA recognition motif-containing protein
MALEDEVAPAGKDSANAANGGAGGEEEEPPNNVLFVENLPEDCTSDVISAMFGQCVLPACLVFFSRLRSPLARFPLILRLDLLPRAKKKSK